MSCMKPSFSEPEFETLNPNVADQPPIPDRPTNTNMTTDLSSPKLRLEFDERKSFMSDADLEEIINKDHGDADTNTNTAGRVSRVMTPPLPSLPPRPAGYRPLRIEKKVSCDIAADTRTAADTHTAAAATDQARLNIRTQVMRELTRLGLPAYYHPLSLGREKVEGERNEHEVPLSSPPEIPQRSFERPVIRLSDLLSRKKNLTALPDMDERSEFDFDDDDDDEDDDDEDHESGSTTPTPEGMARRRAAAMRPPPVPPKIPLTPPLFPPRISSQGPITVPARNPALVPAPVPAPVLFPSIASVLAPVAPSVPPPIPPLPRTPSPFTSPRKAPDPPLPVFRRVHVEAEPRKRNFSFTKPSWRNLKEAIKPSAPKNPSAEILHLTHEVTAGNRVPGGILPQTPHNPALLIGAHVPPTPAPNQPVKYHTIIPRKPKSRVKTLFHHSPRRITRAASTSKRVLNKTIIDLRSRISDLTVENSVLKDQVENVKKDWHETYCQLEEERFLAWNERMERYRLGMKVEELKAELGRLRDGLEETGEVGGFVREI